MPDSVLRAKLTPDFTIGCKRIILSSTLYPALRRPSKEKVFAILDNHHPGSPHLLPRPSGVQDADSERFFQWQA